MHQKPMALQDFYCHCLGACLGVADDACVSTLFLREFDFRSLKGTLNFYFTCKKLI